MQRRLGIETCSSGGNRVALTKCLTEAGGGGTCTANDVDIASVSLVSVDDSGCQSETDTVTFTADYVVELNANQRFDIGLWLNLKGGSAKEDSDPSACTVLTGPIATPKGSPNAFDDLEDGTVGGVSNQPTDCCGDLEDTVKGQGKRSITLQNLQFTTQCRDINGDGVLDLNFCTSWNLKNNPLCTSAIQTIKSVGSKCFCADIEVIGITVPPPCNAAACAKQVTSAQSECASLAAVFSNL
jgi:hypothetical protein